jgi:hypothetical protein
MGEAAKLGGQISAGYKPVEKYSQPKSVVPAVGGNVNADGDVNLQGSVTYFPDPMKQNLQITGYGRIDTKGINSAGIDAKHLGTPFNGDGSVKKGKLLHELGAGIGYERNASVATTTLKQTPGTTNETGGDFKATGPETEKTSQETNSGIVGNVYGGVYMPTSSTDPNESVGVRLGVAKDLTSDAKANPYAEINGSIGLGKTSSTIISPAIRQNFGGGGTDARLEVQHNF